MGLAAMAGFPHRAIARLGRASAVLALLSAFRRRSSVVEHVIGNDGVSSSILLGGTIQSNGPTVVAARLMFSQPRRLR